MTQDELRPEEESTTRETAQKKPYKTPKLVKYGEVRSLTQASTSGSSEGSQGSGVKKPGSSRLMKQDVVRIGTHPLGIGLYLFDYKPEFRDLYGHGRQFGVMADEVASVAPHALSSSELGHTVVDYEMLGIGRFPG